MPNLWGPSPLVFKTHIEDINICTRWFLFVDAAEAWCLEDLNLNVINSTLKKLSNESDLSALCITKLITHSSIKIRHVVIKGKICILIYAHEILHSGKNKNYASIDI